MTARASVPHVLVVGNATIDENIVAQESSGPCLGGTGAIVSLALARFGSRVTWLGHVGADAEHLLQPLEAAGVRRLPLGSSATLRFENRYPDPARLEHRLQRAFRLPPPFTLEEIEAALALARFDYLALGPLTPQEISLEILEALVSSGIPVAVDLQGYLRRVERDGGVLPASWPRGRRFPGGLGVVHVDEAEARLLAQGLINDRLKKAGRSPQAEAGAAAGEAEDLALTPLPEVLQAELLCVTYGARGATLFGPGCDSGLPLRVPGFPPPLPVEPRPSGNSTGDATGCGDIFLAALVHGELCGWPPARSGRFASAAAAWNVSSRRLRIPTVAEAEGLLRGAGEAGISA